MSFVNTYGQTDSLLQAQQASQKISQLNHYLERIRYYHKGTQYDSIYATIRVALPIARKSNSRLSIARLYYNLGLYYRYKGKFDQSIQELKKAHTILNQLRDTTYIHTVLYTLGITYYDKGDYEQAVRQALTNMAFFEKKGLTKWIAYTNFTLRDAYTALQDKPRELHHIDAILHLTKGSSNPIYRAAGYDLKAASHEASGSFALAQPYRERSLREYRLAGNTLNVINALLAMAANLRNQGLPVQAQRYLQEAYHLSSKIQSQNLLGAVSSEIALNEVQQKKFKKAQQTATRAVTLIRKSNRKLDVLPALLSLATIQKQAGDYRSALQSFEDYLSLNDSLISIKKIEKVAEIQAKYDLIKKENAILLLEKNAQLQRLKLNEQTLNLSYANKQRIILIGGISALLFLLVIIVYFLRQTHNSQKLLAQQKEEIEKQAIELQEVIQFKDRLFSIISHDLRSPVSNLNASLLLAKQQHRDVGLVEVDRLEREVKSLQHTLDNLLYWSINQQSGLRVNLNWINLTELVAEVVSSFDALRYAKELTINFEQRPIFIHIDEDLTLLILRNILHNAIKFTPSGGSINLSTSQDQQSTTLTVRDTGIGMNVDEPTGVNQKRGQGTGLGLLLSRELMKQNKGHLQLHSQLGKGTSVILSWPNPIA